VALVIFLVSTDPQDLPTDEVFPRTPFVAVLTFPVTVATSSVAVLTFPLAVLTSPVTVATSSVAVLTSHLAVLTSHLAVATSSVAVLTSHLAVATSSVDVVTCAVIGSNAVGRAATESRSDRGAAKAQKIWMDADAPAILNVSRMAQNHQIQNL
jgi:hypothetical protein